MMPLSQPLNADRRTDNCSSRDGASLAVNDGAFSEWMLPLQAGAMTEDSVRCQIDVGNSSAVRQRNGAPSTGDTAHTEEGTHLDAETMQNEDNPSNNDNANDNGILASILASCTTREKPRVYHNYEQAGLPAKELERMARALHDSAVAGRPKLSLGVVLPELGEIRFDVQIAGKVVFIHAFVENERAATALALAVSSLRDRLEEHQLILGRLDVTSPGGKDANRSHPAKRPISGRKHSGSPSRKSAAQLDLFEEGIHVLA